MAAAVFAVAAVVVQGILATPLASYAVGPWATPEASATIATWFAASVLLASAAALLLKRNPPRALRTASRAVAAVFLFYVVTAGGPAYGGTDSAVLARLDVLAIARWAAIACGIAALWRPALTLPLILYVLWYRLEVGALYPLKSGIVDLQAVACFGLLLGVSWILLGLVARIFRRWLRTDADGPADSGEQGQAARLVLLFCTAAYLSNYFMSGWGKVWLDGPTLAWLTGNRTDALIPVSEAMGSLPLAGYGTLSAFVYRNVAGLLPLINAMTLVVEMSPVVAVVRLRFLAVACAALTGFHLVIFLLSGIFFWKWAFVDGALALAFWRMRHEPIPPLAQIAAVLIVLAAPHVLPTARLAWYDTPTLNESYFAAVTDDGTRARVPSNYFLSESLPLAQMRLATGLFGRTLPTGIYGGTLSYDVSRAAAACELGVVESVGETGPDSWPMVERFVREHHAYIVAHADAAGHYAYDLYPHHIWSNPVLYRDFAAMDKRRIVRYELTTDYVCVGYDDRGIVRHRLGTNSHAIPVR